MTTTIAPKRITTNKNFIAVPRRAYAEFLAWQKKIKAIKTFKPTVADKRILAQARKNFAKGNYITLQKLKHELGIDR